MLRGIDGRPIFAHEQERRDLLARMGHLLPESGLRCFAWALMSNHLHLVVQTGPVPLGHVMRRLNTGFALAYNRRRDRRGYVFQDRFRSRLATDDVDLIGLIRYVHANPLEAGLVRTPAELERSRRCGHGALTGRRAPLPFESVGPALALFADDARTARRRVRGWLDSWTSPQPVAEPYRAGPTGEAAVHPDLSALVAHICRELGVSPAALVGPGRPRSISEARALLAYRAVCEYGIRPGRVAAALGVGRSAITQAVARGRRLVEPGDGTAAPSPF